MKVITKYKTALSASMTSSQNYIPVSSIQTQDGHTITAADFDSDAILIIEPGSINMEIVSVTGIEPTKWTGATRGLAFYGGSKVTVAGLSKPHEGGSVVIMSNAHYYYDDLMDKSSDETVTGQKTFTTAKRPILTSDINTTDDKEFVSKGELNRTVIAGAVDADTTHKGVVKTSVAPVSPTSPIAVGDNDPRVPTQPENDALAGTSGAPSSLNKYVTNDDTEDDGISVSQTTQNGTQAFGEADATGKATSIAQSFIATRTSNIGVKLYKAADTGSFTGSVVFDLFADNAGSPDTVSLATLSMSNATWLALGVGEFTVTYSSPYLDTIGSTYWVKESSSTADNSNHPNLGTNTAGGYADGIVKRKNTTDGWVTIATIDLYFKVLSTVASKVVRTDTNGKILETIVPTGTYIQGISTMPAYEALTAGNLLKSINDSGTYKIKKIIGLGADISGTTAAPVTLADTYTFSFCFIGTNKIVIAFNYSNSLYTQVGTISGSTITFGTPVQISSPNYSLVFGGLNDFKVLKVANDSFVLIYGYTNGSNLARCYATAYTVSGVTISAGSQTELGSEATTVRPAVDMCEINTGKFVAVWKKQNGYIDSVCFTVSGNNISKGTNISPMNGSQEYIQIVKLDTDAFAVMFNYNNTNHYYIVGTVATTTITYGTPTISSLGNTNYYHAVNIAANVLAIAWISSTTTLNMSYITRSGNTLTSVGSTAFALEISASSSHPTKMKLLPHSGFLYFYNLEPKLTKFSYDASGNFAIVKTIATLNPTGAGDMMCDNGNSLFLVKGVNSTTISFKNVLLDHDEFLSAANAAYSIGASVTINTIMSCFTALKSGVDYYVPSDAITPTILSTYQKIGKAINATTIIK